AALLSRHGSTTPSLPFLLLRLHQRAGATEGDSHVRRSLVRHRDGLGGDEHVADELGLTRILAEHEANLEQSLLVLDGKRLFDQGLLPLVLLDIPDGAVDAPITPARQIIRPGARVHMRRVDLAPVEVQGQIHPAANAEPGGATVSRDVESGQLPRDGPSHYSSLLCSL